MLSIIVLSSDGYEFCWEPIFMSFKKYFSGIEDYELILSTNSKTFTYPGLAIKTVTHGFNDSWSKRVKKTLEVAENEIVLVLTEDFFLRSKIDKDTFHEIVKLMQEEVIDHVRLVCHEDKYKAVKSKFPLLYRIEQKTNHRFLFLPGLWKKQILKKYLTNFEMPYMAEKMGNQRAQLYKDKFYSISQEYIQEHGQLYDSSSSGAIYKGKWVAWVKNFSKEHNLNIDFSERGFGDEAYNKKMRDKTLIGLLKTPISTFRSLWSVVVLFFKVKLKIVK